MVTLRTPLVSVDQADNAQFQPPSALGQAGLAALALYVALHLRRAGLADINGCPLTMGFLNRAQG